MKRTDLEVGKWYYNPMMETHGVVKLKYTRISEIDSQLYPGCNFIKYGEGVTSEGLYFKFSKKVTQSNEHYETEMEKVDDKEVELYVRNKKFGL